MSRSPRQHRRMQRMPPISFLIPLAAFFAVVIGGLVAFDLLRQEDNAGAPLPPVAVDRTPLQASGTPASGPDLRFDASAVDFGVVPLNTEVGYSFTYTNAGSAPLRIEDVRVRVVEGC
ncbi:MAG TPA: hypothetical protein VNM43_07010 [Dehalococcoidia bacterium]|nr:hypothetical protein [Dehalococcoidia bacterium]